jgi:transcriptional regulator GlxA family with amidase domain
MRERMRSGETDMERVAGRAAGTGNQAPIVRERRLLRVMQSMESQLPHSVRELAQQVHLSPAHLQRLFKQETGVHIGELLTERRLTTAANLLTSTEMGVKEIAYLVGYGHHSSFVRAFHRRFGHPPKRYRQACA